jgi:hypothetical protein
MEGIFLLSTDENLLSDEFFESELYSCGKWSNTIEIDVDCSCTNLFDIGP